MLNPLFHRIFNSLAARVIFLFYYVFSILWMILLGISISADAEWLIDGKEIIDICKALRAYSQTDARNEIALFSLLLMIPMLVYIPFVQRNKKIHLFYLLAFLLIWAVFFIYPYPNCPIF